MDLPEGKRITVTPTGAALGADVAGVDLSKPLDPDLFRAIETAWHQHLVLRFRGQRLDDPGLLAFARRFGELDKAPVHAVGDTDVDPYPEITVMSNIKVDGKPIGNLGHYEAEWHTDMSYNETTPHRQPALLAGGAARGRRYRLFQHVCRVRDAALRFEARDPWQVLQARLEPHQRR